MIKTLQTEIMKKIKQLDYSEEKIKFLTALPSFADKLGNTDSFQGRVSVLADIAGGVAALSRISELSISGLNRYIKDGGDPGLTQLNKFTENLGVSFLWIGRGEGDVIRGPALTAKSQPETISPTTGEISSKLFNQVIQALKSDKSEFKGCNLDILVDDLISIYNEAVQSDRPTDQIAVALLRRNQIALAQAIAQNKRFLQESPDMADHLEPVIAKQEQKLAQYREQERGMEK